VPSYVRVSDNRQVPESEAIAGGVLRSGYKQIISDGERVSMSFMLMDSARARTVFHDAAGKIRQLYDATNGAPVSLNEDLIKAIVREADRLNMSVDDYLKDVARYTWHAGRLGAAHLNPETISQQQREAAQ
jgi:hypothetical protein